MKVTDFCKLKVLFSFGFVLLASAMLKIIIEMHKYYNIFLLFEDKIYNNKTKIENNN
jgi:hypothetical protein